MNKLFRIKKENLKKYLESSEIDEGSLLIKKDGTIILDNLKRLKYQVTGMQKSYLESQAHEIIKKMPPFEWHPYIEESRLNERILLLGTFPPPSYLIEKYNWDQSPKLKSIDIGSEPEINYFYGNMASLWKILNIDLNDLDKLKKKDKIIAELKNKGVGISDIILSCQRLIIHKKERSNDTNLFNIVPNLKLIQEIIESKKLERILFTSTGWDIGVFKNKKIINADSNTMGIFLKSLSQFYAIEISFNDSWIALKDLIREEHSVRYPNEEGEVLFKGPNFMKIRIHKGGLRKELNLIGLPSPSALSNLGLEDQVYFKLWKKYTENKGEVYIKENYKTDLYRLAFSNNLEDLNKLFEIQSTNIIDE